jgi:hypothetical protein
VKDEYKGQIRVQILELIVISITISGLFLWSRSEARDDTRGLEDLISSIHRETYQEMKDFHGRLCVLEENKKRD